VEIQISSQTTLAKLAFDYYGSSLLYRRILDENPELISYIYESLPIGKTIRIPPQSTAAKIETPGTFPWATLESQQARESDYPSLENLTVSNGEFIEDSQEILREPTRSNIPIAIPFSFV
jgi:hypothetical protein